MDVHVTRYVRIPGAELEFRYVRSGGPGGRHANKTSTKVELTWDVSASAALGPRQRARLLENLGPRIESSGVLRIRSDRHRSQSRNREDAIERLATMVREALVVRKNRIATGPSAGAKRKRLEQKKKRAGLKQARKRPTFED